MRSGILSAIEHDVDRRAGSTARRILAAGAAGVIGAVGATLLVSTHPLGHHPPWHVVVFGTLWSGLLVVSFAIAFLELRTPSLPLARAATTALLGLGIAGVCGVLCGDQHFLHWWTGTAVGAPLARLGGATLSAVCFGFVSTLVVGLVSSFLVAGGREPGRGRALLPALMLLVLLAPGVALQSFGTTLGVFGGWLAGTAAGAFLGIAVGSRMRGRVG